MYPNFGYVIPDIIFIGLLAKLFLAEGREVVSCYRHKMLREYAKDLWNLLDWFTIICGTCIAGFWFDTVVKTESLNALVGALGPQPAHGADASYRLKWGEIIEDVDTAATGSRVQMFFLFWYTLILMLRFFKAFQGQPRLSQIGNTLLSASFDVFHFLVIFSVVFINFALGGHIVFGSLDKNFSTLPRAVNVCLVGYVARFVS